MHRLLDASAERRKDVIACWHWPHTWEVGSPTFRKDLNLVCAAKAKPVIFRTAAKHKSQLSPGLYIRFLYDVRSVLKIREKKHCSMWSVSQTLKQHQSRPVFFLIYFTCIYCILLHLWVCLVLWSIFATFYSDWRWRSARQLQCRIGETETFIIFLFTDKMVISQKCKLVNVFIVKGSCQNYIKVSGAVEARLASSQQRRTQQRCREPKCQQVNRS